MLTVGSLFSGIGGLDLGLEWAGFKIMWQSEIEPFCCKTLEKRWPEVPNYGDIREINGRKLPPVDLICGGFPCQDLSCAGKRKGLKGERSGLFYEMSRIIGEARPKYALFENVPGLVSNGLGLVMQEIRLQNYIPLRPILVEAASVGAPHKRERIFIIAIRKDLAHPEGTRRSTWPCSGESGGCSEAVADSPHVLLNRGGKTGKKRRAESSNRRVLVADADTAGLQGRSNGLDPEQECSCQFTPWACCRTHEDQRLARCGIRRISHGIPNRVDRLKALGNAVVPQVAMVVGMMIMELDKELGF